jgi:hypothetical protein
MFQIYYAHILGNVGILCDQSKALFELYNTLIHGFASNSQGTQC